MSKHYLSPLFSPASIALFGASDRPGSVGEVVYANLLSGGFEGPVCAINPDQRSCEFALVVSDRWQKKGIGHHLMSRLIAMARDRGLDRMVGEVLSDNVKMLGLVKSLGFRVRRHPDDLGVKQVELDL